MPTRPPPDRGPHSSESCGGQDRVFDPDDVLFPDERFIPDGATLTCAPNADSEGPKTTLNSPAGLPLTDERYRLESAIARGSMGLVCKGREAAFGRNVAVKFLLDEHLDKPDLRRRFFEEARITASLDHPGIAPIYGAGEFPGGRPFYAMRLIDGETLAVLLASRACVRTDRSLLLKVFEKVCEALAYAHSAGVIHRDLKPANVMVGGFGVVKVMDWGVAKVLAHSRFYAGPAESTPTAGSASVPMPAVGSEDATQFGRVLGTPAYMSPEQANGDIDRLDERTDVFGLGGILCEVLTGLPPYGGTDARMVYSRAVRADLTDAFVRLDACGDDPELVALCKRCLAPDPVDRPRDAGTLAGELTEYLDYDLRRAERDLVRFFELSPDLFCIAGLNGYFRRVNPNFSRILGYSTVELLTRPFIEFVHNADRERTLAEINKLVHGLPCVRFRNRYRDIRGDYRWFEWTAKPIPEEGLLFAVARDVTDQAQLENQLREYRDD